MALLKLSFPQRYKISNNKFLICEFSLSSRDDNRRYNVENPIVSNSMVLMRSSFNLFAFSFFSSLVSESDA